jgi:anaerobic ribonucleoside-triphosphate reductase activating protein
MRIHQILHGSHVNGPGTRSVVWFQGCQGMNCPGCFNPHTHPRETGTEIDPSVLAEAVAHDAPAGTEGVTVSGGEPMQQALALHGFLSELRACKPGWSIGLFTGYSVSELATGDYDMGGWLDLLTGQEQRKLARYAWVKIREMLDFAICGRFDRTQLQLPALADRADAHLITSANQTVELFSTRYTYDDFPPLQVEATIGTDGLTQITGYPL